MNKVTVKRIRIAVAFLIAIALYYYFVHYYPEKMRHKYFKEVVEADEFWKNATK